MSKRTEQIGEEMLRILSELIQYEVKDPRVGFATVIKVDVSTDLSRAKVHVSIMGDDEQRKATMEGLERAKGFLRRGVAQELNHLRTVPDLRFILDTSLDYSMHIDSVLRQVAEERKQHEENNQGKEQE
jgi:ribosome-binding factor A